MTRIVSAILSVGAILALAACGADGPPVRPTGSIGIGAGTGGATTDATFGATNGIATGSVSIGLRS